MELLGRNGQTHEGGKYSCQSSRIPAIALENALIGRIRELGQLVEARDRIVQEALACLGGEAVRLREEEELARRRLSQVRADIGRLVEVLKTLGAKGLASVQAELERLEEEEQSLNCTMTILAKQQAPVERIGEEARSFLDTWQDVGELLDAATTEERLQILQHYIEVVEIGLIDPLTRTGTYAMRLFPEVRPDRGFDFDSGTGHGPDDRNPRPETSNGAGTPKSDGPAVLTDDGFVRTTVQKAPRPGFEPRTSRLTAGCSTVGQDKVSESILTPCLPLRATREAGAGWQGYFFSAGVEGIFLGLNSNTGPFAVTLERFGVPHNSENQLSPKRGDCPTVGLSWLAGMTQESWGIPPYRKPHPQCFLAPSASIRGEFATRMFCTSYGSRILSFSTRRQFHREKSAFGGHYRYTLTRRWQ